MLKQEKGITLFALVFTILAMLALAAVATAMIIDELHYDPEPVQVVSTESPIPNVQETIIPVETAEPNN